jgi:hypothetical protein
MTTATVPLPALDDAVVVVPAPAPGPGNWSGAPSAIFDDGVFVLAFRVRRPLGEGRGIATQLAISEDGIHFTPICEVRRDIFGAESLERPAIVRRPDGGWRLYVSCATPGSKHWWIEALDADSLDALPSGRRTTALTGSDRVAVKDPVVTVRNGLWQMWACEHPLTEPGHEDRMSQAYFTSEDGLSWQRHATVLTPSPHTWDARGTRLTAVLSHEPLVVLYDGRGSAEANWHESTGLARGDVEGLVAATDFVPLSSPHSGGAFRYVSAVALPDGSTRFYFEVARPDGAHDLVTSLSHA